MKLYINDILYAFSYALDCVEYELVGIASQHGKRVAYICLVLGEDNIKSFPFNSDVSSAVLYHHENSDGSGPFGKKWFETHIYAQLIHLADSVDVQFNLSEITEEKYDKVLKYLNNQKNIKYHESLVELFEKTIDYECLVKAQDLYIKSSLEEKQPVIYMDYSLEQIVSFVDVFANIIDYKSEFTMKHSMGIAKKAATMAKYYEYDEETIVKLYFAGAVHDIGKLVIDKDVLEKPDKLTDSEFIYMKNHAYYTYEILKDIRGFEDITAWASMHHEKLNGQGYPFGKTAEDLSFNERLMGCLDIYQALTETRPYKHGFTHEKTIKIMRDMSKNNFIDDSIVSDINKVFSK